jgi:hypothetical protein
MRNLFCRRRIRHVRPLLLLYAMLLVWMPLPQPTLAEPLPVASIAVPATTSVQLGLNTHLATRYPDAATLAAAADVVAHTGTPWVREDLHWWRIQPTATTWDWVFTDEAFAELKARNIAILGVIGHPPGWATPDPHDAASENSFSAPDPQQFAAFAQAVVRRYGHLIQYWEIWNEPDHPSFWKPQPDPVAYAALLMQTAQAIRVVDPQAKILIGGVNPFSLAFLNQVAEQGAWGAFDILAIHPYVDPLMPEAGLLDNALTSIRTLLTRYGQKPIWVTEIGWASGPGDRDAIGYTDTLEQADYLVRSTLLLGQSGITHIFWYTLKDDAANPYGLFAYGAGRADFRLPKPSHTAFQRLQHLLDQAQLQTLDTPITSSRLTSSGDARHWLRGDRPFARLYNGKAPNGASHALQLRYAFPGTSENFVVFFRQQPLPLPGTPHMLGLRVYGDGSGNLLRVWLRDAQGELLQFALGRIGPPGWQQLNAPLRGTVEDWNRISAGGDGQLQFPVALEALVIDRPADGLRGRGQLYLGEWTIQHQAPQYQATIQRPTGAVRVFWSTEPQSAPSPVATPWIIANMAQLNRYCPDLTALVLPTSAFHGTILTARAISATQFTAHMPHKFDSVVQ